MNKWAITTSKERGKHGFGLSEFAQRIANELQIPIILRNNQGIEKLILQYGLDILFVEAENTLTAYWADGQSFVYHPGMSVQRIRHIKDGEMDLMIQALQVQSGDSVLDCTMGMASDAVTISFVVGAHGRVTALESSAVIYAVTSYGLHHWNWKQESKAMRQAMDRIVPIHGRYETYLQTMLHRSAFLYDSIYFDPMFDRPVLESSGICPLRKEANYAPITQEILNLASELCRKRVVVKHRAGTGKHLKFDDIIGGKYSTVAYGIIEAKGARCS